MLMSGSAVCADAPDGAIDRPTAIAGATADARRPQREMSRRFTFTPLDGAARRFPVIILDFAGGRL
jgi:hypothetical protein